MNQRLSLPTDWSDSLFQQGEFPSCINCSRGQFIISDFNVVKKVIQKILKVGFHVPFPSSNNLVTLSVKQHLRGLHHNELQLILSASPILEMMKLEVTRQGLDDFALNLNKYKKYHMLQTENNHSAIIFPCTVAPLNHRFNSAYYYIVPEIPGYNFCKYCKSLYDENHLECNVHPGILRLEPGK